MPYKNAVFDASAIFHFFFVATCATAMCLQTHLLLGQKILFDSAYIFVFGCTVFVYNYQNKHAPLRVFAYIMGILAGFVMLWMPRNVAYQFLVFSIIGACYFFLPASYSLRSKTFLKPFVISWVWVFMCVKLPTEYINCPDFICFSERVSLIGLEKLFFIASTALGYDILDVGIDTKLKLATMPVRFGVHTSKRACYVLLLCSFWVASYSFWCGYYTQNQLLAIACSLIIAVAVILLLGQKALIGKHWIDASLLIQSFFVFVAS